METRFKHIASFLAAALFFSCNNMPSKSHGPIVLGDSSTIVTETDPQKLRDLVTDLQPVIKPAENTDSTEAAQKNASQQKAPDTAKKNTVAATQQPQVQLTGNGLNADFKTVSILIPGLDAKIAGNPNMERVNGAVYSFISGNINGNQLQVTPNVTKVSQRYQTVIVVKNQLGTLPLESLSITSSWSPLKGANNIYKITGLDAQSLDYTDANRNTIRNAVLKTARRRRMNHRRMAEWEQSVRNVRSSNQKPCYVILRSVMWKIDGKDANGRIFSKQIRVDMPL